MKKLLFAVLLICSPVLAHAQPNDAGSPDSQGAKKFVDQFWSEWSGPNSDAMPYIQSAIDDQINFYGKSISRDAYMKVQVAFAKRWPDRQYTVQSGSEDINCDQGASTCNVNGIVDWKDFSPERGSLSTGSANFSFLLREQTVDGTILYLLTGESGSVISRNLSQATSDSAMGGIASSQPPAPPPTTPANAQSSSSTVSAAIETESGNYLTAVNGGGLAPDQGDQGVPFRTNATTAGPNETFTVDWLDAGHTKFALQTANGNYVTAVGGGGISGPNDGSTPIHTDATAVSAWETFQLDFGPNNSVAIQLPDGDYLSAINGGGIGGGNNVPLHTDATQQGAWEVFTLVPLSSPSNATTPQNNPITANQGSSQNGAGASSSGNPAATGANSSASTEGWASYSQRDKTLIEKVVNYTLTAQENGTPHDYTVSGEAGADKCVVSIHYIDSLGETIEEATTGITNPTQLDIRSFDANGFQIQEMSKITDQGALLQWIVSGDESLKLTSRIVASDPMDNAMFGNFSLPESDRLQNGWGLVFQQCPGKQGDF
jgi:hypothetical protein